MFGFLRPPLERAAIQYGRKLPGFLSQGWGGSKFYKPGQIETAVNRLGLDPKYIGLAYAAYLPEAEFAALPDQSLPLSYSEAREVYFRFAPARPPKHRPSLAGPEDSLGLGMNGDSHHCDGNR